MDGLDLSSLKDRSVLVIGGASGIGLVSAKVFASAGAYVTIADFQPSETVGVEIVSEASFRDQKISYIRCDVANWNSQVAAFRRAIKFSPRQTLDIVLICPEIVCDHGSLVDHLVGKESAVDEEPPFPAMECVDLNLIGAYYSTYLALNYMRLLGSELDPPKPLTGSLIFLDSMAELFDFPQHTGCNVSKTGCRALFRSIRSTTESINHRCNLVTPWFAKTPLTSELQAQLPSGKGASWMELDGVALAVTSCAVKEDIAGGYSTLLAVSRSHSSSR
jgi:5'-hydroxyaverantin dehydrogenase